MPSAPVMLCCLERENAVTTLRETIGATDPAAAAEGKPYTKTGGNGVYERRHELPEPFHAIGKHRLAEWVGTLLDREELVMAMVDGSKLAAQSTNLFWQLCERDFQALVNSCDQDKVSVARRHQLQQRFARYAQQAYDRFCPKETARQLDAWAKCRPNHSKYLKQEA